MISLHLATDEELAALGAAIDALTREDPDLIHVNRTWSNLVHAFANEIVARAWAHPTIELELNH
jgi:hypothetical protein